MGGDLEDQEGEKSSTGAWIASSAAAPRFLGFPRRIEGHLGRSRPGGTGPVQRKTWSRGGGSVSSALHTYLGLVSVSRDVFSVAFRFRFLITINN